MTQAPYSIRLATGLIVTALEESRKLPTQLITLPMTAVSNAVQAGMRLQQNVAEMVIKGDATLSSLFDKPEEQPAWAVFDEDEEPADSAPAPTPLRSAPEPKPEPKPEPTPEPVAEKAPAEEPAAAPKAPAKKAPVKKAAAKKAPAKKAPAKKAPAKAAAKKAPAKKAPAAKAPAADTPAKEADGTAGRFALYSSVPEVTDTPTPAPAKKSGPTPEVAEFLDYDNLTLAQLRAKIRTVDVEDLRVLVDYERDGRSRTPFVTMLENRIAAKTDS